MSVLQLYVVDFQISKASASAPGAATAYRKEKRRVTLSAASAHPKDILSVLNADIAIGAGEVIEVLAVAPASLPGTEGGVALA